MKRVLLYLVGVAYLCACGGDNEDIVITGGGIETKAKVNFLSNQEVALENEGSITVKLSFDKAVGESSSIDISITEINAGYGEEFTTSPAPNNGIITLSVNQGQTETEFVINVTEDEDNDDEQVRFNISAVNGGLEIGTSQTSLIFTIQDQETGRDSTFDPCLDDLSSNQLDVVTWNIEFFPMRDGQTIEAVKEIITNMNADVIAVQEINNISDFNSLGAMIPGWTATVVNLSGSLDIGFLYKTSEISVITSPGTVLGGSVSPRPPVQITVRHTNGLEVTLLNIHLKCCNDGVARRESASIAMKAYIDENLSDKNVILLGDFNDDINNNSPFDNFIDDTANYAFADADIAAGSSSNWSFPSWPSHIDHILITNELFDNLQNTKTIKLESCVSGYGSIVSDHRPILASFSN